MKSSWNTKKDIEYCNCSKLVLVNIEIPCFKVLFSIEVGHDLLYGSLELKNS